MTPVSYEVYQAFIDTVNKKVPGGQISVHLEKSPNFDNFMAQAAALQQEMHDIALAGGRGKMKRYQELVRVFNKVLKEFLTNSGPIWQASYVLVMGTPVAAMRWEPRKAGPQKATLEGGRTTFFVEATKANPSILNRMKKEYGVTESPSLGFYITPEGEFLDGSLGTHMRLEDHKALGAMAQSRVAERFDLRMGGDFHKMNYLMRRTGLIRWIPENNTAYLVQKPTNEQVALLKSLSRNKPLELLLTRANKKSGELYGPRRELEVVDPYETEEVLTAFYGEPKSNPPGSYPVMSLSAIKRWEPVAKQRGVSKVARGPRGFLTAYKKAGSYAKLSDQWKRKRNAFIARHMAQGRKEKLWKDGRPSRRALALMMWAYKPPK